jgi:hypothetical protein
MLSLWSRLWTMTIGSSGCRPGIPSGKHQHPTGELTVAGVCANTGPGSVDLPVVVAKPPATGVDVRRLPIDDFAAMRRQEIASAQEGEGMQNLKWILIAVGVLMLGGAAVSLAPDIRRYARMRAM